MTATAFYNFSFCSLRFGKLDSNHDRRFVGSLCCVALASPVIQKIKVIIKTK